MDGASLRHSRVCRETRCAHESTQGAGDRAARPPDRRRRRRPDDTSARSRRARPARSVGRNRGTTLVRRHVRRPGGSPRRTRVVDGPRDGSDCRNARGDRPRLRRTGARTTAPRLPGQGRPSERRAQVSPVRVAVVTARRASAAFGDSDTSPTALLDALRAAGHHATEVAVPADHSTLTATLESYARCYALDLAQYDLAISTGAPTFMASHPNHTSYLTHVLANAYASPGSDPSSAGARWAQQRTVQALDRFGLRPGRVRRHFSRGHTIYRRLRDSSSWWTTVGYRALPHPPALSGFVNPRAQNHILVADRPHEQ